MSVSRTVSQIVSNNGVTLKSGLGGHSRSLEMAPFDRSHTRVPTGVPTMATSCVISETKRDIGRKLRFFSYPLHSMPPLGVSVGILSLGLVWKKLEWCCYAMVKSVRT